MSFYNEFKLSKKRYFNEQHIVCYIINGIMNIKLFSYKSIKGKGYYVDVQMKK